jgi:hypothetical protein
MSPESSDTLVGILGNILVIKESKLYTRHSAVNLRTIESKLSRYPAAKKLVGRLTVIPLNPLLASLLFAIH